MDKKNKQGGKKNTGPSRIESIRYYIDMQKTNLLQLLLTEPIGPISAAVSPFIIKF